MPVVGEFHRKFWKAKAGAAPPATPAARHQYPLWQGHVVSMAVFGPPLGLLVGLWCRLRFVLLLPWWLLKLVWKHLRCRREHAPEHLAYPALPLADSWLTHVPSLDRGQWAVMEQVMAALRSPTWPAAQRAVRACAQTPDGHKPEAWVEYSRTLKGDAGQTQNVYRHLKVALALKQVAPLTNPQAHLLAELAYHEFAARGH